MTEAVVVLQNAVEQLGRDEEAALNDEDTRKVVLCLTDNSTPTEVVELATQLVCVLFSNYRIKIAMQRKPRPIVDAIFTCLKNHTNTPVIQQHILKAIGNLTGYLNCSQNWLVEDQDAINLIVGMLKRSPQSPELQAQAYYALQELSNGHVINIGTLAKIHCAHELALASMSSHPSCIPLQTQACALLRRLSFVAENTPTLMIMASSAILYSMQTFLSEAQIQEHGCTFLNNLANEEHISKVLLNKPYSAHHVVVSAMQNHSQNADVQKQACRALANLAQDDAQGLLLFKLQVHCPVIAALRAHPNDQEVQLYATWTLTNISYDVSSRTALACTDALALCEKAQRTFPNNLQLAQRMSILQRHLDSGTN